MAWSGRSGGAAASQRLRFALDFAYGTGLRASEFVGATLRSRPTSTEPLAARDRQGSKAGKVALPPLARSALNHFLAQRGVPTTPARWNPNTPLLGSLVQDSEAGITTARLWNIVRRFFDKAADVIGDSPAVVDKPPTGARRRSAAQRAPPAGHRTLLRAPGTRRMPDGRARHRRSRPARRSNEPPRNPPCGPQRAKARRPPR